jgi:hypothetical protein
MLITEVYYNDYLFILYILIVNTCGNKIYKIMFLFLSNAHFLCNRTPNEHFAYLKQAAKSNFVAVALRRPLK